MAGGLDGEVAVAAAVAVAVVPFCISHFIPASRVHEQGERMSALAQPLLISVASWMEPRGWAGTARQAGRGRGADENERRSSMSSLIFSASTVANLASAAAVTAATSAAAALRLAAERRSSNAHLMQLWFRLRSQRTRLSRTPEDSAAANETPALRIQGSQSGPGPLSAGVPIPCAVEFRSAHSRSLCVCSERS
jgi:hypothetical protein